MTGLRKRHRITVIMIAFTHTPASNSTLIEKHNIYFVPSCVLKTVLHRCRHRIEAPRSSPFLVCLVVRVAGKAWQWVSSAEWERPC